MLEVKTYNPTDNYPRWRFRCYGDLESLVPIRDWVLERFPYPPTKKKLSDVEANGRELLHSAIREIYSFPRKTYKYTVSFRDAEAAMLFKLTWAGK